MKYIEWAFILTQLKKGIPLEALIGKARPAALHTIQQPGNNYYLIEGYFISEWEIRRIYESPLHFERLLKFHNHIPNEVVINDDWLNHARFVMA